MTLEEEVRRVAKAAAETVEEGGTVPPTFMLEDAGGRVVVCPFEYDGAESKDAAVALVRVAARAIDAVRVVYVSEAWISSFKSAKEAQAADVPPSRDPDRKEVIIVTGEELTKQLTGSMAITRAEGRAKVGPLELMDHAVSRFHDLLPGKGPRQ